MLLFNELIYFSWLVKRYFNLIIFIWQIRKLDFFESSKSTYTFSLTRENPRGNVVHFRNAISSSSCGLSNILGSYWGTCSYDREIVLFLPRIRSPIYWSHLKLIIYTKASLHPYLNSKPKCIGCCRGLGLSTDISALLLVFSGTLLFYIEFWVHAGNYLL